MWLWPSAVYSQLNSYLQVRLIVLPQLIIAALGAGLNIMLNWFFIYHADMGFRGSPLATTSTRVLLLLALGGWWWYTGGGVDGDSGRKAHVNSGNDVPADGHDQGSYEARQALVSRIREFAKLCGPLALGNSLEEWQIQLIGFFAGALGETAVATHNGMLQVFFVLTSIQWGILKATQVRVGHCLGCGHPLMAKRVTAFAFIVSFAVGVAIALLLVLLRSYVGHLFSSSPAVWHSASELSWMVGVGYVGLSIFFVAMAALSAQGRGGAVAVSFFFGAWCVSVPVSYFLSERTSLGLVGVWLGLIIGYCVITVIAGAALLRSDWFALADEAVKRSKVAAGGAFVGDDVDPDGSSTEPLLCSDDFGS
eukprot:g1.t1